MNENNNSYENVALVIDWPLAPILLLHQKPTYSVPYPEYTFWPDGIKIEWYLSVYMYQRGLESPS